MLFHSDHAINGDVDLMRRSCEYVPEQVNFADADGNTPLHHACHFEHLACIKLLIDLHAKLNTQNQKLETPLHIAVKTNNANIVALLLQCGAHKSIKNAKGYTPLDYARNEEIIRLLTRKKNQRVVYISLPRILHRRKKIVPWKYSY